MTMRPEDIKNRTFANALRGYDKDEVRSFLFKVAESSRELHDQLTATEAKLASAAAPAAPDEAPSFDGIPAALAGAPAPEAFQDGGLAADEAAVDSDVAGSAFDFGNPETSQPIVDGEAEDNDALVASDLSADSLPTAEAFVEAPTIALAETEQSIADRYGAIGDRIADLLRNADESAAEILAAAENDASITRSAAEAEAARVREEAEERASQMLAEAQSIRAEADAYRDEVMAELANARLEQEAALQEARAAAENDVETYRVDSIEEIKALRADAFVEIDELRSGANVEVNELRTTADTEIAEMREAVLAEATASIADDEADAARLREEAETDRAVARAELEDVRAEVSSLLEQARTQSEFIKQEADEIIRTKVRANFEQAQTRIDVLRNTEVASRERIVLAQTELASALTRLDSEPLPELDPNDSPAVIEEAERRHEELAAPTGGAHDASPLDAVDADLADEANVVDTGIIEAEVVEAEVVDHDMFEAADDAAAVDTHASDIHAHDIHTDVTVGEAPAPFVDVAETDLSEQLEDTTTTEAFGGFAEAAVEDTTVEETEAGSLQGYFGPGPAADEVTTGDILSGAFDADTDTDDAADEAIADSDWPVTEVGDATLESGQSDATESDAADFGSPLDSFGATDHVVVESTDIGDLPVRGQVASTDDLPVRGQATSEETYTAPPSFGAASLSEALPPEMDSEELGGASQEDALARLVREAMQEAVDSARKND